MIAPANAARRQLFVRIWRVRPSAVGDARRGRLRRARGMAGRVSEPDPIFGAIERQLLC
jgi:hypothetical protein